MLLPSTDNHVLQKLSDMMVDQYVWKDLACFMTAGFRENVTGDSPNRLRPLLKPEPTVLSTAEGSSQAGSERRRTLLSMPSGLRPGTVVRAIHQNHSFVVDDSPVYHGTLVLQTDLSSRDRLSHAIDLVGERFDAGRKRRSMSGIPPESFSHGHSIILGTVPPYYAVPSPRLLGASTQDSWIIVGPVALIATLEVNVIDIYGDRLAASLKQGALCRWFEETIIVWYDRTYWVDDLQDTQYYDPFLCMVWKRRSFEAAEHLAYTARRIYYERVFDAKQKLARLAVNDAYFCLFLPMFQEVLGYELVSEEDIGKYTTSLFSQGKPVLISMKAPFLVWPFGAWTRLYHDSLAVGFERRANFVRSQTWVIVSFSVITSLGPRRDASRVAMELHPEEGRRRVLRGNAILQITTTRKGRTHLILYSPSLIATDEPSFEASSSSPVVTSNYWSSRHALTAKMVQISSISVERPTQIMYAAPSAAFMNPSPQLHPYSSVTPALFFENYMLLAATSLYCYDYCLTFDREVKFFWGRRPSLAATLFFTFRYAALLNTIPEIWTLCSRTLTKQHGTRGRSLFKTLVHTL
ncbi:hypothetical protein IEO21_06347 [Rhodonia placenta]|uniref:DUF6533 domain-containing protein n=1 Tax=Rhodonia placenta TaxID=104341 RepID=A0A8H7P0H3_9APHY|nr:hypothetical protein IEO21_06347 [Postia placenta]